MNNNTNQIQNQNNNFVKKDNEFRGSAYTYYNNEHFWGTTPGADIGERKHLSEQQTEIFGVTLGGPIIKNKLYFFVAGEFNRNATPSSCMAAV